VEQLASMSEGNTRALGLGYPELRTRARDFLEAAKGEAPLVALREENTVLKARVATLEEELSEAKAEARRLRESVEMEGGEAPRRKRGRPAEG
jgi:predicted  nucleic acid-binding Zn-ribbon protein